MSIINVMTKALAVGGGISSIINKETIIFFNDTKRVK